MKKMTKEQRFQEEREIYLKLAKSSLLFVEKMFGLTPQPCKPEYKYQLEHILSLNYEDWEETKGLITADWFGDYDEVNHRYTWYDFQKGKHITWQQFLIMTSYDKALNKQGLSKISITSGHGIGKSSSISWLILHFLFGRYDAQVPCTAPTATQMHDVLWKELSLWISKMPPGFKELYEWNKDYIRMKESPETWFARAKTSSKENSEALAGVHADWVLTVADEASGVEEQIFNTAQGAWTSGNIVVILISNPTRINGFFYDTHHKLKKNWQNLQFSSIGSPIVDPDYEREIAERHGRDSQEYAIRVLGLFPKEDSMDDSGYVNLLTERDISEYPDIGDDMPFNGNAILGVDPAGDGDDKTSFVLRDQLKMRKLYEESKSNAKGIAEKILTFIDKYHLNPANVIVDNFGTGADVAKEVAIASKGRYNITTINGGDQCDYEEDRELYLNKRAEMYYKMKQWIKQGGQLVTNKNMKEELLIIKYKRNMKGLIQIMPKVEMKKKYGYASPNDADAAALTFMKSVQKINTEHDIAIMRAMESHNFDPDSPIFDPF